jgi:hypothetical protein
LWGLEIQFLNPTTQNTTESTMKPILCYLKIFIIFSLIELCAIKVFASDSDKEAYVNPYVVENVEISLNGPSTQETRLKAISMAHRQAFNILLSRLDASTLSTSFKNIQDEELEKLIQDIEVIQEKLSPHHYKAVMIVRFNQEAVEKAQHLEGKEVTFERPTSSQTGYLLIPMDESPDGLRLWEEENELLHFFHQNFSDYEALRISLPAADLQDIQKLSKEKAKNLDHAAFLSVLERYKIPEGLVVRYRSETDFLDVFLVSHKGIVPLFSEPLLKKEFKERLPHLLKAALAHPSSFETTEGVFEKATIKVISPSLDTWTHLQKTLRSSPLIKDIQVLSLESHNATMRVTLKGREKTLRMLISEGIIQGTWPNLTIMWERPRL